jgi:hypothetical protein
MIINPPSLSIENNIFSKPNKMSYFSVKSLLSRINLEKEIVLPFLNSLILVDSRQINVAS